MAQLITQFEMACSNVEPEDDDVDHASEAHQEVRKALAGDAELAALGIDTILIGSYKRHVSIRRVKDVDVFSKTDELDMTATEALDLLATESSHQRARPVVIPLTHRLGDPRADAPARVRRATGEDISSLWTPLTLDQSTPRITQPEAAAASDALLGALLPPGAGPVDNPIDLLVSTRGTGQPPTFLSIDATTIVGGKDARPGSTQDWQRFLHALRDVEATLARWAQSRLLRLRVRAHLTAAIGVGRVFNQAAGWQLDVEGRHGLSSSRHAATTPPPNVSWDPMGGTRDLLVEIDLLGHPVSDLATFVAASLDDTPVGRLQIRRAHSSTGDLLPYEIAAGVTVATREIRTIVGTTRPASIHMFCASPVEFAVLLGHRLTSLHADVHLYERHGDEYHASLTLDRTLP